MMFCQMCPGRDVTCKTGLFSIGFWNICLSVYGIHPTDHHILVVVSLSNKNLEEYVCCDHQLLMSIIPIIPIPITVFNWLELRILIFHGSHAQCSIVLVASGASRCKTLLKCCKPAMSFVEYSATRVEAIPSHWRHHHRRLSSFISLTADFQVIFEFVAFLGVNVAYPSKLLLNLREMLRQLR